MQSDESRINRSFDAFNGMIFKPDHTKGLDVHVDASFAGDWNKVHSEDSASILSRTDFVLHHMGCPIFWTSKFQTEISLTTTEAEHIALSHSMREALSLITLLEEMHEVLAIDEFVKDRIAKCTVFEDNDGCIEIGKSPKLRP